MLSPYALDTQAKLNIGKDTCEKLVPTLSNKYGYVADIRNIAYYIEKGLKVTKVHQAITFNQSKWLEPYINFNDYIKNKYGDRAQLLMTDTDSLMYHIKTEDFYEDMKKDSHLYDMSNFDCDLTKQFKDNTNKKVLGKMKDEGDGMVWNEMVGLRPKMYSAHACGSCGP
eukprot:SAG22_NODE_95_length_20791_cov_40.318514_4_plen_169_part_00